MEGGEENIDIHIPLVCGPCNFSAVVASVHVVMCCIVPLSLWRIRVAYYYSRHRNTRFNNEHARVFERRNQKQIAACQWVSSENVQAAILGCRFQGMRQLA